MHVLSIKKKRNSISQEWFWLQNESYCEFFANMFCHKSSFGVTKRQWKETWYKWSRLCPICNKRYWIWRGKVHLRCKRYFTVQTDCVYCSRDVLAQDVSFYTFIRELSTIWFSNLYTTVSIVDNRQWVNHFETIVCCDSVEKRRNCREAYDKKHIVV